MKVFTVLLLAAAAIGHHPHQQSEWRQFYNFAVSKAMESCLGKDNVNKYTVNLKKAVAKCQQQDAPELDLPPYRSMYKFVNTIINSADQMDQQKLHQVFVMLRMMNDHHDNYDREYHDYDNYNSGHNWMKKQWMKYKMHQMMQQFMKEDNQDYHVRPYSMDTKMDSFNNKMDMFDMMKNNKMDKFEMMKMMKDIMQENQYSDLYNKQQMMKMMKNFFGNDHSADEYNMMENFFRNKNNKKDMEFVEMMKMMMKFSEKKQNMDMSEMMHKMKNMYGYDKDFTMNEYKPNKFDMMKRMNEKSYEDKSYKDFNYSPPQARYRFKRQASGSTKPVDYTKPATGLDKGDRLFAKLQEEKREMEEYIGNMTCVLKETDVLNKDNQIDVKALKRSMQQYALPSPWFKDRFEELIDVCYETATNLPASIVEEQEIEGTFGLVNIAHVKTYMKCLKEGKQKLCMNLDTKNKIESNFGPIEKILKETKLTEYQLFPLVQQMLQGEESEFMGFM